MVENKRLAILAESTTVSDIQDKDILSLLSKSLLLFLIWVASSDLPLCPSAVKANLAFDPSKRLPDDVILDQLSTLLFAASDTTALAMSWCIHLLSLNTDIQTRLRKETLSLPANSSYSDSSRESSPTPSETPSCASFPPFSPAKVSSEYPHADAIEALPFLDCVVREVLRLCPPVHSTIRTVTQNDTIPISSPCVLRDGKEIGPSGGISIRKGSYVHIPIEGLNMSEDIWGKDAREFKYVPL